MEFDLFGGLESLAKSDYEWYEKLSDDGKKQVAPLVLARWLSGTSDYLQLIKLNMLVNPYTFSLGNEKGLLCKLMAASTTGPKRHQWIKGPGASQNSSTQLKIISDYYEISLREASLYLGSIEPQDLLEMADELGVEKDILTKLKKELSGNVNEPRTTKTRGAKSARKP